MSVSGGRRLTQRAARGIAEPRRPVDLRLRIRAEAVAAGVDDEPGAVETLGERRAEIDVLFGGEEVRDVEAEAGRVVDPGPPQRIGQPVEIGDEARVAGVEVHGRSGGGEPLHRLRQQDVALVARRALDTTGQLMRNGVGLEDHRRPGTAEAGGHRVDPVAVVVRVRCASAGEAAAVPLGDVVGDQQRTRAGFLGASHVVPGLCLGLVDVAAHPQGERLLGDLADLGRVGGSPFGLPLLDLRRGGCPGVHEEARPRRRRGR